MSLTNNKNGTATLGNARHLVCLEAAFELKALARMRRAQSHIRHSMQVAA